MYTYKTRPILEEDLTFISSRFENITNLELDKFSDSNDRIVLLHSAPFIDEDSYFFFKGIIEANSLSGLKFFFVPVEVGDTYLEFKNLPDHFDEFRSIMEESTFHYAGGLGFDSSKKLLFYSSADVEILSVQLSSKLEVPDMGKAADFLLSNENGISLINEHRIFLSSNS
ncbi:hypothetical protein [Neolewinella persica]|uniref:hypothetical protein n=1 Tax=Neolewinella persica TaxID=70998 RepID=UPI00038295EC|nr:hypothetical protein [Neolewinella persica]